MPELQAADPWRDGEPAYLCEYREVMALVGGTWEWGDTGFEEVNARKWILVKNYAYAVPTLDALKAIAQLGPLFEASAGSGYWARLLQDLGCVVTPYDVTPPSSAQQGEFSKSEPWTKVYGPGEWTTVAAELDQNGTTSLFVCWPYRGGLNKWIPMDYWQRLALITDGPTGGDRENDRLYQVLDTQWRLDAEITIPTWPYTFDKLTLWSRP